MDHVAFEILKREVVEDCRVLRLASKAATAHLEFGSHGRLEATAFELARVYNIFEQMGLRVARFFENHFEREGGWHQALVRRLTLDVPSVRPAFLNTDLKRKLDELRRFRHLVTHAYDLELREDRMKEMAALAALVVEELEARCPRFFEDCAKMHGWQVSP